jgi:hypothetical protein
MTRRRAANLVLLVASVGLACVLLSKEAWGLAWLRSATYFTTAIPVGVFLARAGAWARRRLTSEPTTPPWRAWVAWVREHTLELAFAGAAMGVLFLTHDGRFKVLGDETNLVAVGRSLADDHVFSFPDDARFVSTTLHLGGVVFDKRPPLFGFVLGSLDALAGYRVANVWVLNGLLLGTTVAFVAIALRARIGRPWNLLAVTWAIANPVVLFTARGATVEPLLGLLWVGAGACALAALEEPSAERVGLLTAACVLLGLSRMEAGPMAALLLLGVLAARSSGTWSTIRSWRSRPSSRSPWRSTAPGSGATTPARPTSRSASST